jgi:hypothetical protein
MTAVEGGIAPALIAATQDGRLIVRAAAVRDMPWTNFGHAEDVVTLAVVDKKLFASTRNNKLWVRDL